MKKAHSCTSLSNIHSETQKLRRQNANVLRSRSVGCLLSHMIVEFPNNRHMYALRTYFFSCPCFRSSPTSESLEQATLVAVIGGFRSDLSITRKTGGNFGNVSAGVLFSKIAYQRTRDKNLKPYPAS